MKYLKILISIVVVGLIIITVYRLYDRLVDTKSEKARIELHWIYEKIMKVKKECGYFPKTLSNFNDGSDTCITKLQLKLSNESDPWGNEYIYISNDEHFFLKTKEPNSIITDEAGQLFYPD